MSDVNVWCLANCDPGWSGKSWSLLARLLMTYPETVADVFIPLAVHVYAHFRYSSRCDLHKGA